MQGQHWNGPWPYVPYIAGFAVAFEAGPQHLTYVPDAISVVETQTWSAAFDIYVAHLKLFVMCFVVYNHHNDVVDARTPFGSG